MTFDAESKKAIKDINKIIEMKEMGWIAILIGQLAVVFGGLSLKNVSPNNSFAMQTIGADANQTAISIYQTNWEYFFKSFSKLDAYANNQISTIAGLQYLRNDISSKERVFWSAIYNGCKIK